ncbi:hypothetical protein ES332_D11G183600v1 [Gossypium tomentosum]|uniref:Uncharacterized protein n=1 Tax=Gossypium tomentosum TaxID=34277 RepID=A0A5D2IQP1_GOSTO|nr:hypothetical protein ES332_D11G183600v1 [Gossypium tomentosum]
MASFVFHPFDRNKTKPQFSPSPNCHLPQIPKISLIPNNSPNPMLSFTALSALLHHSYRASPVLQPSSLFAGESAVDKVELNIKTSRIKKWTGLG